MVENVHDQYCLTLDRFAKVYHWMKLKGHPQRGFWRQCVEMITSESHLNRSKLRVRASSKGFKAALSLACRGEIMLPSAVNAVPVSLCFGCAVAVTLTSANQSRAT